MKTAYLPFGSAKYTGTADNYVRFTVNHQLMNANTWENFVRVYRADSDDGDNGWRGEYWGKMMRGACLTYQYTGDEELYAVLEKSVCEMLEAQRDDGRFSTYSREAQLHGWDVWGRKYVLTAMLHFLRICHDANLKNQILTALCAHVDALIADVGHGKTEITATSNFWGGVNSCSILDAVVELYQHTKKAAYLEFAEYIISTGGCEGGNLIALALEDKVMPYQYPEVKAYETMSFFEGVLTYYQVTGEQKYFDAVQKFIEAVYRTDITVIGCCGCTHELFDNSALRQNLPYEGIMQETCVTVTWMRMMARMYLLTGNAVYMERMEQSAYNALYGSVNSNELKQMNLGTKEYLNPLPFDSYSPLYYNSRGRGIGGLKMFSFGGYYGCCACIAAAGIALFPLCATMHDADGIRFNTFLPGKLNISTRAGKPLTVTCYTEYPAKGHWEAKLTLTEPERFAVRVRMPSYCEKQTLCVNGESVAFAEEDGYAVVNRQWQNGDALAWNADISLKVHTLGDTVAFTYGALTLARDSAKEGKMLCSDERTELPENLLWTVEAPQKDELLRLQVTCKDGSKRLLTDYASCGKNWMQPMKTVTVWMTGNRG